MRHLREGAVVSAQVHGHKSLAPTAPGDLSDHRSISRESSRLVQLEGVDNPGENRRTLAAVCDHLLSRDVELLFLKVCFFFLGFLLFVVERRRTRRTRPRCFSLFIPCPIISPWCSPPPFPPPVSSSTSCHFLSAFIDQRLDLRLAGRTRSEGIPLPHSGPGCRTPPARSGVARHLARKREGREEEVHGDAARGCPGKLVG